MEKSKRSRRSNRFLSGLMGLLLGWSIVGSIYLLINAINRLRPIIHNTQPSDVFVGERGKKIAGVPYTARVRSRANLGDGEVNALGKSQMLVCLFGRRLNLEQQKRLKARLEKVDGVTQVFTGSQGIAFEKFQDPDEDNTDIKEDDRLYHWPKLWEEAKKILAEEINKP